MFAFNLYAQTLSILAKHVMQHAIGQIDILPAFLTVSPFLLFQFGKNRGFPFRAKIFHGNILLIWRFMEIFLWMEFLGIPTHPLGFIEFFLWMEFCGIPIHPPGFPGKFSLGRNTAENKFFIAICA